MKVDPIRRKPLRSVSMILTCAVSNVAIDDLPHGVHAAEGSKPGIAQSLLNLRHPETHCALDAFLHFADDRLDECLICCNGCQSRAQPFWRNESRLQHLRCQEMPIAFTGKPGMGLEVL